MVYLMPMEFSYFFEKLDLQFMYMTGEALGLSELVGTPGAIEPHDNNIVALDGFKRHCPMSRDLMEVVLNSTAA